MKAIYTGCACFRSTKRCDIREPSIGEVVEVFEVSDGDVPSWWVTAVREKKQCNHVIFRVDSHDMFGPSCLFIPLDDDGSGEWLFSCDKEMVT